MMFTKQCPSCGKHQNYKQRGHLVESIKNNRKCISCSKKGFVHSELSKNKISLSNMGKKRTDKMKQRYSDITKNQWQFMRDELTTKIQNATVYKKRKRPYEWLLNKLSKPRKDRKVKYVNLSYEEFLEFIKVDKCHYCNTNIVWSEYTSNCKIDGKCYQGYNLDRKDNNSGYTKDNCVVCCYECNRTKGNHYSYDEMLLLKPILTKIKLERLYK